MIFDPSDLRYSQAIKTNLHDLVYNEVDMIHA